MQKWPRLPHLNEEVAAIPLPAGTNMGQQSDCKLHNRSHATVTRTIECEEKKTFIGGNSDE